MRVYIGSIDEKSPCVHTSVFWVWWNLSATKSVSSDYTAKTETRVTAGVARKNNYLPYQEQICFTMYPLGRAQYFKKYSIYSLFIFWCICWIVRYVLPLILLSINPFKLIFVFRPTGEFFVHHLLLLLLLLLGWCLLPMLLLGDSCSLCCC